MVWNNIPQINDVDNVFVTRKNNTKTVGEWCKTELERLIRYENKVIHPPDGGKDFADCIAMLVSDLTEIEAKGTVTTEGLFHTNEPKLLALAERYMIERQRLRNDGITDVMPKQLARIANTLGISIRDANSLRDYASSIE